MSKKSKCDGEFAMSPKAHLGGVGCPECAAEENSAGTDESIQVAINCLRKLAADDRIIVWDPTSKKCLSGRDIEHICANGPSVQIGLSRAWACRMNEEWSSKNKAWRNKWFKRNK